ncbi:hypothetical protein ACFLZB_00515 [Nanoarchaeota archaeon]
MKNLDDYVAYEAIPLKEGNFPQPVSWPPKKGFVRGDDQKTFYGLNRKKFLTLPKRSHPILLITDNPRRYFALDKNNQTIRFAKSGKKFRTSLRKINPEGINDTHFLPTMLGYQFFDLETGVLTPHLPEKVHDLVIFRNRSYDRSPYHVLSRDGHSIYNLLNTEQEYQLNTPTSPEKISQINSWVLFVKVGNGFVDLRDLSGISDRFRAYGVHVDTADQVFSAQGRLWLQHKDRTIIYSIDSKALYGKLAHDEEIVLQFPQGIDLSNVVSIEGQDHAMGLDQHTFYDIAGERFSFDLPREIASPLHQLPDGEVLGLGQDRQTLYSLVFNKIVRGNYGEIKKVFEAAEKTTD